MAQEQPPPIPPAEMPQDELRRLVDEGRVSEVEQALRAQNVRLPAVLEELERVLELGLGNLAASLATTLISSFHVARAGQLADKVLRHADSAGSDELIDLTAALLLQERLSAAEKTVAVVLEREPKNGRALYLSARLSARRGQLERAFESIAKVSPDLLGGAGLAVQARYAALAGRLQAASTALKLADKRASEEERHHVVLARAVISRCELLGLASPPRWTLRSALAIEYGSLLVEIAQVAEGRFGMDPIALFDAGRLIDRMIAVMHRLGLVPKELCFATEDGEIVAAAFAQRLGVPARAFRDDQSPLDGSWLCMASASTHPHVGHSTVQALQHALDAGTLRSLALILPAGWRAPLVPDLIGRITGDDELPWRIDDEVDETVASFVDPGELSAGLHLADDDALFAHVDRVSGVLRAAQPAPRPAHVAFLDETPVPRAPG